MVGEFPRPLFCRHPPEGVEEFFAQWILQACSLERLAPRAEMKRHGTDKRAIAVKDVPLEFAFG